MKINDTLNELLVNIFMGVDYVSNLALRTGKSIPVVYRQLELLKQMGVINKERDGKKVIYKVNWTNLSEIVGKTLILDLSYLNELKKKKSTLATEAQSIMENLPADLLKTPDALGKLAFKFFSEDKFEQLLVEFFETIEIDKHKQNFEESISEFLDVFGMMDSTQQNQFLKKYDEEDNKDFVNFLQYCRLNYLNEQMSDPKRNFYQELTDN